VPAGAVKHKKQIYTFKNRFKYEKAKRFKIKTLMLNYKIIKSLS